MRKKWFSFVAGTVAIFVTSCNMSDFEMNRFAKITGLDPVIYRPVSYGSYAVKDYLVFPQVAFTPVPNDSLTFNPISYPINGFTFNTTGSDSMVVVIKTTNEIPMRYRYTLSFNGTTLDSRTKNNYLNAAAVSVQGDVMSSANDSIEYKLNPQDVMNLAAATQMDLQIVLYKPTTGTVIASVLRGSQISFKIGFRAPVNLLKIKL